jgi:hypothetical protein
MPYLREKSSLKGCKVRQIGRKNFSQRAQRKGKNTLPIFMLHIKKPDNGKLGAVNPKEGFLAKVAKQEQIAKSAKKKDILLRVSCRISLAYSALSQRFG